MIKIDLITFVTGTQEVFTVPNDTGSIALHAIGGNVTMRNTTSGDAWTIRQGEKEAISTRQISNEIIYFEGITGTTLEIRRLEGVLA